MTPIDLLRSEVDALNAAARVRLQEAFEGTGPVAAAALAESQRLTAQATKLNKAILEWNEGRFLKVVGDLEAMVAEERRLQSDILGRLESLASSIRTAAGLGLASVVASESEGAPTRPSGFALAAAGAAAGGGAPAAPGSQARIVIQDRDVDALARVANSEVGHFGRHGQDQLVGGLCAVVDTILNRVANPAFPNSIEAVVNQPKQFSAINPLGSWTLLKPAPDKVFKIVSEHVGARLAGKSSTIGGATHFLNPHLSSQTAMESWGRFVVDNAVASFGNNAKKDVHFHGTAPGTPATPAYVLMRGGLESRFDDTGHALGAAVGGNARLRSEILRICQSELAFFRNGAAKETDDPNFKRVGDYWRSIGKPFDGRTVGPDGMRIAWSAAFISFVLKEAGAGGQFPGAPSHATYFQHFVEKSGPALYRALPVSAAPPQVGDIIHHGRGSAEMFDFAAARLAFAADGFYPSHGALVTEVDLAGGTLATIGGNESNSVSRRSFAIDASGKLRPRRAGSKSLPWIGVLQLT